MSEWAKNSSAANGATAAQKLQLMKQNRARLGNYHFASTSQEILKKYAKYPPSLNFHIYDTHYRFNNTQDSNIVPKESAMAKSFLKHVIREEVPAEMTELLKDFAIKFYDGCLVLQVYDHRRQGESGDKSPKNDDEKQEKPSKPKAYRTLLRPTPQSLYYDLLYHTDSTLTKFTDVLSLQMESEILNLTNRKLDLSVPLNPYLQAEYLQPESAFPQIQTDDSGNAQIKHSHREPNEVEIRKLHHDQLTSHKSSEYEELMFLLSNKYKNPAESTSQKKLVVVGPSFSIDADSTPASSAVGAGASDKKPLASGISSGTGNRFMRLRFIEEIRKRKETQKAQAGTAVAAQTTNPSVGGNFKAQPQQQPTQQQQQQQQQNLQKANGRFQIQKQAASPQFSGQNGQFPGKFGGQPQQMNVQGQAVQNVPFSASPQLQQQNMTAQQRLGSMQAQRNQRSSQMGMMPQYNAGSSPNVNGRTQNAMPMQNQGMQGQIPNQMQGQINQPQMQAQNTSAQQQEMAKQASRLRAQQYQMQQTRQQQMRQQQQQQQQNFQAKRQKINGQNQYGSVQGTPQMNPQATPQMSSQSNSNIGTPTMNGNMNNHMSGQLSSPQMQQVPAMMNYGGQNGQQFNSPQAPTQALPNAQTSVAAAGAGAGAGRPGTQGGQKPSIQQQQQQQIFQMTLTPQEQHTFRQLQTRMNALVQMGNTGMAPNRTRLTPQQHQQAIQQAKHIQQQLLQRFPTYFQRLRQFQALQQQRRQAMQRQPNSAGGAGQTSANAASQMHNQNHLSPLMQQQQQQIMQNGMISSPAMSQQHMNSPMMSQMNNMQGKQQ